MFAMQRESAKLKGNAVSARKKTGVDDDPVIETVTVREVAGVFHDKEALENAIDDLLTAGFDRGDIDIMGDVDAVRYRFGQVFAPVEEVPDIPHAPRRALVTRDDQTLTTMGAFQMLFTIGAFATGVVVVASGGGAALALAAAMAGGTVGGALGAAVAHIFGKKHSAEVEEALQSGGIILWVRVHDAEQQAKAQEILVAHGGEAVRAHDIELEKHLADLPLADFQPDPLLERPPIR